MNRNAKNYIVTAINALTGAREQVSQLMTPAEALAAAKKEIRRGPGRAFHDPRPEKIKPERPEPVQLTFEFAPW